MFEFMRNIFASEQPILEKYNIVDPTAVGEDKVRPITIAMTPPTEEATSTSVSLFWSDSESKVFEKQFESQEEAQNIFASLKSDIQEVAELTKDEKLDAAEGLVQELMSRYDVHTDKLVDGNPPPATTTQANKKEAKVVMQNVFFDTPEEAAQYAENFKKKEPGAGDKPPMAGDFEDDLPLGDGADEDKDLGLGDEEEGDIGPPSLSHKDFEKDKAKEQKSLSKRIEREVKDQVKSNLDQKIASNFGDKEDTLLDAMRDMGRTWEEIREYFVKGLKYDEDSVVYYLDQRKAEETPGIKDDLEAPKPPTDLVSPETHDELVDEILDDKKPMPPEVEEIEKKEITVKEPEILNSLTTEIEKKAEEPLETVPKAPTNVGDGTFNPTEFKDTADEMKDTPDDPEEIGDAPQEEIPEEFHPGEAVYIMGDYETGTKGYEGEFVSEYTSEGEDYAVIDTGMNEMKEVPKRFVKKASVGTKLRKKSNKYDDMPTEELQRHVKFDAMYDKGYWNAIQFAYIPDFKDDTEKAAFEQGWRDAKDDKGQDDSPFETYQKKAASAKCEKCKHDLHDEEYMVCGDCKEKVKKANAANLAKQIKAGVDKELAARSLNLIKADIEELNTSIEKQTIDNPMSLDPMVRQYLATALWSSNDDSDPETGGDPIDSNYDITDIHDADIEKAKQDCEAFRQKAGDLLTNLDEEQVGHDFWLTRNGHGAGFWDVDYEESVGKALTDISKSFGEITPYIGDDRKVYISGSKKTADPVPTPTKKPVMQPATEPSKTPQEVPTKYNPYKKSPDNTKEKEIDLGNAEAQKVYQSFSSHQQKLEEIKALTDDVKRKSKEQIMAIEKEHGLSREQKQFQAAVEKLASLVDATKDKVMKLGKSLFTFINETKTKDKKFTAQEDLNALLEWNAEAKAYLDGLHASAQKAVQTVTKKELIESPSDKLKHSSIETEASSLTESLESMWDNAKALFDLTTQVEQQLGAVASVESAKECKECGMELDNVDKSSDPYCVECSEKRAKGV